MSLPLVDSFLSTESMYELAFSVLLSGSGLRFSQLVIAYGSDLVVSYGKVYMFMDRAAS